MFDEFQTRFSINDNVYVFYTRRYEPEEKSQVPFCVVNVSQPSSGTSHRSDITSVRPGFAEVRRRERHVQFVTSPAP
ncbi:hypothetical protein EYF80_025120 [Liparis tanakae]|uniref:Uncharacterized protein n=1 Tax=Liparis tanakae TaxID=230148 RepID=A0A4Z2HG81_9TELE|nr:hypothetical protein EYF80_025120 [Liparis tanakae]